MSTDTTPCMTVLQRYSLGESNAMLVSRILLVLFPHAQTALDLTPGGGNFWSKRVRIHVSVALSPYDFTNLPYPDASFDVAIFDPPHVADAGAGSVMGQRYGTYRQADLERVVRGGTREAWRVARLGTICKVTDAVHAQRFVRMSGWLYDEFGEPYDVVHRVRPRALRDGKWREPQLSARNNGSTFAIFRKGDQRHLRRTPAPGGLVA